VTCQPVQAACEHCTRTPKCTPSQAVHDDGQ
jgi:hypothetical protein